MYLLISVLLALLPLLGIAYMLLFWPALTVGNLFMVLILLTMSGIFGLNVLLELRQRGFPIPLLGKKRMPAGAAGTPGPAPALRMAAGGSGAATEPMQVLGTVEVVSFYESSVGRPNRSVVTLRAPDGGGSQMVVFYGDVRDQFPVGRQVKVTYAHDGEACNLLERRYV
jgi:hypothetical protein